MRTSERGIELIKKHEGLRLNAYLCPAGVWTIGYGTTSGVEKGDKITKEQAESLLRNDLEVFENAVTMAVRVPITQNQFDALVSFAYNVGTGALRSSTLMRMLNAGDYAGAAAQFKRWNKADGKELPGLTKRRADEAILFAAG